MKESQHFLTALGNWEWKLANNVFGTTHVDFLESSGYTFNKGGGADLDFTVKSDTYDALFIDAGNDSIDIMHHASGKIGFYAATPVTLQTGVSVDAAGIHAALVNLGLITA